MHLKYLQNSTYYLVCSNILDIGSPIKEYIYRKNDKISKKKYY